MRTIRPEIVRKTNLRDFRTLKSDLASLVNRETSYQSIIRQKDEQIRRLEKNVAELVQSFNKLASTKETIEIFLFFSLRNQTMNKLLDERNRQRNNELKFLHCEIEKLHRIMRDDDFKMKQMQKFVFGHVAKNLNFD